MIAIVRTIALLGIKARPIRGDWRSPLALLFLTALLCGLMGPASARGFAATRHDNPPGETVKHGLVVLVQFPDVPHDISRDLVQKRFSEHLDRYINDMSYGKVSLDIDVTEKWYTMPKPISQYSISSRNLEVKKSRVVQLIDDALDAVGKDVDFTKYSFIALMMGAKVSEYGMVGLCGYPGMLGWSTEDVFTTKSGKQVRGGVAIFTSQAHLGTLFHDVAHILGGVRKGRRMVPCLYDHDLQAKPGPMRETFLDSIINMGYWDPMSCHFYKRELPPPGISSWTKIRLGWIDPAKIKVVKPGQKAEVVLGPLEDGSSETLAVKIPLTETTYYLIENRQPLGFDKNLPGSGVLIMYAEDHVSECRHGKSPVKLMDADATAPHLERAAFDVGARNTFQDLANGIQVRILEKVSGSYRISIGAP